MSCCINCSDHYLEAIISYDSENKYDCENLLKEIKEKLPDEYYFFFMIALSSEISSSIERSIDFESENSSKRSTKHSKQIVKNENEKFIENVSKYRKEILPSLSLDELKEIYNRKINSERSPDSSFGTSNFNKESIKIYNSILNKRKIKK